MFYNIMYQHNINQLIPHNIDHLFLPIIANTAIGMKARTTFPQSLLATEARYILRHTCKRTEIIFEINIHILSVHCATANIQWQCHILNYIVNEKKYAQILENIDIYAFTRPSKKTRT